MDWLARERGLDFADYDALWRWSVADIEAFWASIWDYFEVVAHKPYTKILGRRDMPGAEWRSEEHTSELQSLMRISYAVFCLKKKNKDNKTRKKITLTTNYHE